MAMARGLKPKTSIGWARAAPAARRSTAVTKTFIGATCHNAARSAGFLARWPHSPWEGWFIIAVPKKGSPVRWAKAHLFHSQPRRGFHPLSAVEGLESM